MNDSIAQRFDVACRNYPGRTAFRDRSGGPITFEQLYFSVHAIAQRLAERGFQHGTFVAVHIGDIPIRMAVVLAALRLGGRVALYEHPPLKPGEASPIQLDLVDRLPPGGNDPRIAVVDRSWFRAADGPVPQRGMGGIIASTSGTTGAAKLIGISDAALLGRIDIEHRHCGAADAAVLIGYNPTTSVGFRYALSALIVGQAQMPPHQDGQRTLRNMASLGVGYAFIPPIILHRLVEEARNAPSRPALKEIRVGGGATSLDLAREAEDLFGCPVKTAYGSTETSVISSYRLIDSGESGVVGKILPHLKHRFVDEDGNSADEGELLLRVPESVRASRYINAEGPYDADGWVATGDIGRLRPDGNLELTGRRSEFINGGGTKREPGYFEALMRKAPGVAEAIAFAIPNGWGGEDVGILAVAETPPDAAAVAAALRDGALRGFAFRVFHAAAMPQNAMGKVNRRELAERYRDAAPDVIVA